ncbi:hypothetical protein ABQE44_25850, partial [Mycolicibacterium sp. XJ2546]
SVNDNGGWTTRMNDRGEVEWLPPDGLDTGQARLNYYHRPERLLRPDDQPQDRPANLKPNPAVRVDDAVEGARELDAQPTDRTEN